MPNVELSPNTRTRLITRGGKKVRAHRWIMEQRLGRKLRQGEHVHHRNGDPLDNRIENLEVLDAATHMRLHKQVYPDQKVCVECGSTFTVNPRKRRRNSTCSTVCAQAIRVRAMMEARGVWSPKSPNSSATPSSKRKRAANPIQPGE